MNAPLSSHARANRRELRWFKLGGIASGLMLAVSALHSPLPVAAQTVAPMNDRALEQMDDRVLGHDSRLDDVFVRGLDDRQFDMLDHLLNLNTGTARLEGLDDILSQAGNIGLDDHAVADMLVGTNVQQEDRQNDRQLEVNDDRQTGQADQIVQPGDVRQEDRAAETGDVRHEDRPATQTRGSDDGSTTYYTAPASPAAAPAAASTSTSSSATSSSGKSSASGSSSHSAASTSSATAPHSGGHDDTSGHH